MLGEARGGRPKTKSQQRALVLRLTIELVFFVARLELEHLRLGRVIGRDRRDIFQMDALRLVAAKTLLVGRIFVDEGPVVL